jgi:hypothetical protein
VNVPWTFTPPNGHTMDGMPWAGERSWMRNADSTGWGISKTEALRHGWHAISRNGGGGEIRTHERRKPLPVFKTGALNRSATPPNNRESINSFRASAFAIEALRPRKNTVLPANALPTPGKLLSHRTSSIKVSQ